MAGESEAGLVSVQCGSRSVEFSPGLFIHNEFVPSLQGHKFASYVRFSHCTVLRKRISALQLVSPRRRFITLVFLGDMPRVVKNFPLRLRSWHSESSHRCHCVFCDINFVRTVCTRDSVWIGCSLRFLVRVLRYLLRIHFPICFSVHNH